MEDIPDLRTGGYGTELSKHPVSNIVSPLPILDHQGNIVSYTQSSEDEGSSEEGYPADDSYPREDDFMTDLPHEDDISRYISPRNDLNAPLFKVSPHHDKLVSSHEDDPCESMSAAELSNSVVDSDHHWPDVHDMPHEDDPYVIEESIQRLFLEEEDYGYDISHEDDLSTEKVGQEVTIQKKGQIKAVIYPQNLSHEDDPPALPAQDGLKTKNESRTSVLSIQPKNVPPHEDDPHIHDELHQPVSEFENLPYEENINISHEDDPYPIEEAIQSLFCDEDVYPFEVSHEDDDPEENVQPKHLCVIALNKYSPDLPHEDDLSPEKNAWQKRNTHEYASEIPSKVRKIVTPHEDDDYSDDATAQDANLLHVDERVYTGCVDDSDVPHEDDPYPIEESIQRLFTENVVYDLSHEDDGEFEGPVQCPPKTRHINLHQMASYPCDVPREMVKVDTSSPSCPVRKDVGLHEDDSGEEVQETAMQDNELSHIENMYPIRHNLPHEDDSLPFGTVLDEPICPFGNEGVGEDILDSGYLMNYALPPRDHSLPKDFDNTTDTADHIAIPLLAVTDSPVETVAAHTEQTEAIHDKQLKRATPQVEELFVNLKDVSLEREMSYLLYLIYWRDVKKTGVVFGSMMFVFLSLLFFSVLSVLAYLSLAILTVTLSFRVYKNVLQAVQKTGNGHPFKQYLEMDIELPDDKVQKAVEAVLKHVNCTLKELRRLFLIEDIIDSVKFGLLLWMLTYVGSWFNGMTLVILGVVSIFTLPKIYETYKVQIDSYINMVRTQLCKIMGQIMTKLPFLKKKVKRQ